MESADIGPVSPESPGSMKPVGNPDPRPVCASNAVRRDA